MKIRLLSALSCVLLFYPVQADEFKPCEVVAPFKLLNQTDAQPYQLTTILAETTSPYAVSETKQTDKTKDKRLRTHIVNFWAAWCAPCREELPLLDKLSSEKMAEVTLINVGDSQETAENILQALNVTQLKTRLASGDILSKLSMRGLPASVLFSNNPTSNNQQIYLGMGKLKDEPAIKQWLHCLAQSN